VLTGIGGVRVRGMDDMANAMDRYAPGDIVVLDLLRGRAAMQAKSCLGSVRKETLRRLRSRCRVRYRLRRCQRRSALNHCPQKSFPCLKALSAGAAGQPFQRTEDA